MLGCRRTPQFLIPQTCLPLWKSWQLLSDLLHQVMPISSRIGLRSLRATDLCPSFPLSPLWQTHPEHNPHPQLHTPLQAFQSHSCSPPSPHPPPAPTLGSNCTQRKRAFVFQAQAPRQTSQSPGPPRRICHLCPPSIGTSTLTRLSAPAPWTAHGFALPAEGPEGPSGSPLLSTQFRQGKDGESLPHLCSITCSVSSHSHGSHSGCLGPHTPSCDSFSSSPAHRMQSLMPLPSIEREGKRERG